jgi:hypothetical protein
MPDRIPGGPASAARAHFRVADVARTTQLGDGALDAGARDGATDGAADGALTLGAADGWPADGVLTLGAADGTTGTVGTGVVEVLQAATPRATPAASAKLAAILRIMIHLGSWAEFGWVARSLPPCRPLPGSPKRPARPINVG